MQHDINVLTTRLTRYVVFPPVLPHSRFNVVTFFLQFYRHVGTEKKLKEVISFQTTQLHAADARATDAEEKHQMLKKDNQARMLEWKNELAKCVEDCEAALHKEIEEMEQRHKTTEEDLLQKLEKAQKKLNIQDQQLKDLKDIKIESNEILSREETRLEAADFKIRRAVCPKSSLRQCCCS